MLARFIAAAQVVSSLDHPSVVRLLDVGQLPAPDHYHYLVFEYLDGLSLADILRALAEPLEVITAVQIITHVARALQVAHDSQIVHRDIKPANIFLARVGVGEGKARIVVLDFGIAKLAQNAGLTQTGQGIGTPIYMAPEQARDARAVDQRADVYSLATVALEMLTGLPPPGNPAVLAAVSEELEATFRRALSHRPDHRWSSVSLFAERLASEWQIDERELDDARRLGELLAEARGAKLRRWLAEATEVLPGREPTRPRRTPRATPPHNAAPAPAPSPGTSTRPAKLDDDDSVRNVVAGLVIGAVTGALVLAAASTTNSDDE